MSELFNICIPVILRNEAGFVNDPDDPGGVTNYGISLRFLKGTGDLDFDLDHDGDIDAEDIKRMTPVEATQAYQEYFWEKLNIDGLQNKILALQVFDHAVNAGTISAIKLLQRVSGCKEDGICGPKTIAAANSFRGDNIAVRYAEERIRYYSGLVKNKPVFVKYIAGWSIRAFKTYLSYGN